MKYTEILEMLKLEGAKPLPVWEAFTGDGWYKNNGYVAIPDTLPFNYLDKHYRILDLAPIHSMTYEGYAWVTCLGEIKKAYFDMHPLAKPVEDEKEQKALQEIKEKYVTRIFGFDDDHIDAIEYPGLQGAVYLKRKLQEAENMSDRQRQAISLIEQNLQINWNGRTVKDVSTFIGLFKTQSIEQARRDSYEPYMGLDGFDVFHR